MTRRNASSRAELESASKFLSFQVPFWQRSTLQFHFAKFRAPVPANQQQPDKDHKAAISS
jgi:hypothetical protein